MAEAAAPAETPAAPAATPAPAAEAAPAATPSPGAAAPATPTKDQKLESDALADATARRAARETDLARAKLIDQFGPALEHLTKGEIREFMKKALGPKYTPELVLELTADFPPIEELSVEERVEKVISAKDQARNEAERLAKEAAAAEVEARVEQQIVGFIDESEAHAKANLEQYPGIEIYGVTGEEVEAELLAQFKATGTTPDPPAVLAKINERKWAQYQKTRFAPKPQGAGEVNELDLDDVPVLRQPTPGVVTRKKSVDEEIAEELEEHDRRERQKLRRA